LSVLETERLSLRLMSSDDAVFILQLLNEPSWLHFIGDRGVRTLADARDYILNSIVEMYDRLGFGFYVVELRDDKTPIGLCGLVKRDFLEDVDIGYALLPTYWGKGYALEAAQAVMTYGTDELGLKRILAIASADNQRSMRLLEKLGLRPEREMISPMNNARIMLFGVDVGEAVLEEGSRSSGRRIDGQSLHD
jgi:RimJ/RimL family protein N-acetyltransferase